MCRKSFKPSAALQFLLGIFLVGQAPFASPVSPLASDDCVPAAECNLAASQAGGEEKNKPGLGASAEHAPSLDELPRKILSDQKFLWLRPFRLKRDDTPWAAGILGTTAGLMAIDRRVGQELSESPPGAGYSFGRRVGQFGSALTDFGVAGTFYLVGRWRCEERTRATGVLGLQALADTMIVVEILKAAAQRPRPTTSCGRLRNHNADGEFFAGGNSFPSGHAAEAWALATVVSRQYPLRHWIPATAYGLAGLVSASRIAQRTHFPSDVFVGSVLGYLIGRRVSHASHRGSTDNPRRLDLLPYVPSGGGAAVMLSWQP